MKPARSSETTAEATAGTSIIIITPIITGISELSSAAGKPRTAITMSITFSMHMFLVGKETKRVNLNHTQREV